MLTQKNTQNIRTHSPVALGRAPFSSEPWDATLVQTLNFRASTNPDGYAFTFLEDGQHTATLTYGQLDRRARAIARELQQVAQTGDRALLLYPPGLEFVCAFFGCLYSGVLAVPTAYPKPRRPVPRLSAIIRDCAATTVLTDSGTLPTLGEVQPASELARARWVETDKIPNSAARDWSPGEINPSDLAFIQYTSGSTSEPKGVMVSHGNLTHNLKVIHEGFDIERSARHSQVDVFWLPAHHDMGLIGGILGPVYVGGHSVFMSPAFFLQQPLRWLRAISDHRAAISGAPNFAYELCMRRTTPQQRASLDLSSWKVAFCGAEPIQAETLEQFGETFAPHGFRSESFYPCYGLAECTLLATGPLGPSRLTTKTVHRAALGMHRAVEANTNGSAGQRLVSCGRALLDHHVVIADPNTGRRCEENEVGEIWISGPSVAQGYWQRTDETKQTFGARLSPNDHRRYLRTGDLGFLSEGELYVTGRLKEVIIIRGQNHYPQDIERTAEKAHPALRWGSGAAFAIDVSTEPQLVVVHEVDRKYRSDDLSEVARKVRRGVTEQHGISPHAIVLIRQASLPKTTSGKTQRSSCRRAFQDGTLKVLYQWIKPAKDSNSHANTSRRSAARPESNPTAASKACSISVEADGDSRPSIPHHRKTASRQLSAAAETDRRTERIESWLVEWLVQRAGIPRKDVDREKPFAEYGVDSLAAVELSHELEEWLGVQITATLAWNYPTPLALSRYLARKTAGVDLADATEKEEIPSDSDFERLLAEVEALSDDEAEQELRTER